MTQLQLFTFADAFPLRIITIDGEPWFIAADVCKALGIGNVSQALGRLDDDEKLVSTLHISGQDREVLLVNESGLYNLILTSNKPQAKPFKKWVTGDVLPTIRKTGSYGTSLALPDFSDPAAAAEAWALQYRETKRKDELLALQAPKVEFVDKERNGYLVLKKRPDERGVLRDQTLVTGKGLAEIQRLFA